MFFFAGDRGPKAWCSCLCSTLFAPGNIVFVCSDNGQWWPCKRDQITASGYAEVSNYEHKKGRQEQDAVSGVNFFDRHHWSTSAVNSSKSREKRRKHSSTSASNWCFSWKEISSRARFCQEEHCYRDSNRKNYWNISLKANVGNCSNEAVGSGQDEQKNPSLQQKRSISSCNSRMEMQTEQSLQQLCPPQDAFIWVQGLSLGLVLLYLAPPNSAKYHRKICHQRLSRGFAVFNRNVLNVFSASQMENNQSRAEVDAAGQWKEERQVWSVFKPL